MSEPAKIYYLRKKVQIGSKVEFKGGFKGEVIKIKDNSVIVDIYETPSGCESFPNNKTVVNHKNYLVI